MSPDEELAGVYHWIGEMCSEVPAPVCKTCSQQMTLTPPEFLYFTCFKCFPQSHSWEFYVEELPGR